MDRVDTPMATSVTGPSAEAVRHSGVGSTFRALAQGTSTERRRRSLGATARAGRAVPARPPGTGTGTGTADSGTWRLAL